MVKINDAVLKLKKDNIFAQNINVVISHQMYGAEKIVLSFGGKRLQNDEEYAKTCERSRKSKEAAAKRKVNKANVIITDVQVFKKLAEKLGYVVRKK